MPQTVTVTVQGLQELGQKLQQLSSKIAKRSIRNAARAGAAVVRKQAQALVPIKSGTLKKAIVIKRSASESKDGLEVAKVGINALINADGSKQKKGSKKTKGAKKQPAGPVVYGRFLEFGTSKQSPHPFLAPAFDSSKEAALSAIVDKLRDEIARP